ncbi:ligand-binding sensor domain-containing protein [Pontibacter sp. CAU 1760]
MRNSLLSLVFSFLVCASAFAQVKNEGIPYITTYSQKGYKASPQNWAVVQDHRGLMYFGNNFGVLEFDGNHWRTISLDNRTIVRSLAVDRKGRVYVGGQDDFGYLQPDVSGLMRYRSLKDKLAKKYQSFDDVWKIYTSDDDVFFCTVLAVYRLRDDEITVYEAPVSPSGFPFIIQNKLLVPVPGKGIYELKNNRYVLIPDSELFADKVIVAMLPYTGAKSLIMTEEDGIYIYDGYSNFEPTQWQVEEFLARNKITTAIALGEEYALGTSHNGLLIIDKEGKPRQHLNREKGLQNSTVRDIYQDHGGNLWLALNNGIDYVETNSAFTLFNAKNGLPGTGYTSLMDGEILYLGTNDGLYYKTWSNAENPLNPSPFRLVENSQGQVYNLQKINGQLLMSHHTGPYTIKNNRAQKLSNHLGAWVFVPLSSHPGYVLCGTYNGLLLYKFIDGQLMFLNRISGFDESSRIVEEDKEGNIWVAHGYKGVYKLQLTEKLDKVAKLDFYNQQAGFPSNLFINVFKVDGKLVFTGERGVYKYNKAANKFEPHEELNKFFGKETHVRKLIEDSEGNIWFSSGEELGVLKRRSNGSYEMEKMLFNKLEGKLIGGFEHIMHYNQQNVLIGIDEGFVHYHPTYLQAKNFNKTFQVLLRRIVSTAQAQDSLVSGGTFERQGVAVMQQSEDELAELPYEQNSLKFTYSAISYDDIDKVQYQYKLEGFEHKWSPWTSSLQKEYTNLPEGGYTFRVRAKNVYGTESEEATYSFVILPPWYRSVWAYVGYLVLGVLLLLLLKHLMDQHINATKAKLQEEKEKELKLKEARHMEEVLKAEKEIIRLNNEKLENELVHKNKELTSSAVHVMQNMQAVHKVRDQLQETLDQISCKDTQKQVKKLLKSVDEEIKFENNWEQFELHFDQVHQDFLKRLRKDYPELTHRDLKLCAYLRLNLTSKEIASLLKLSLRGIETSRYRIRKKMNLDQEENLTEFVLNY